METTTKISQIIDTLNDNDKQYHYDYQQGRKYLKIYYSMILSNGEIRENNKSILYFYESETDLLYKANSWKQKGNILMSGNEFLTRNTFPTTTTQPKETMNTTTTTPDTITELELNNSIEKEIEELTDKLTARNDLLVYLEKNNINGKIQTATEEEIAEIQNEIEELTAKLDPRPELRKYINNVKNSIANDLQKIADATAEENTEEIAFYLNGISQLNYELSALIKQLAEADIKHAMKAHYSQNDNITPIKLKTAETTQETTTELILTAPPTLDPQNVIQLFPKKKTLDQLRKELTTPEAYQNLIDNFDTYTQEYQNLNLHGLQLIRDDYSAKDANGQLKPSYDQWLKFMQSYEELTNELRKKN